MSLVKRDERQQVLVKKAQASYTPLKRPAVVLEEDDYIDGLSQVIKRQFFPDLHEFESQGDNAGASTTSTFRSRTAATPRLGASPRNDPGTAAETETKARTDLSLSAYQAKYTSEDNASFLALLDKQNLLQREKHAWHYNGNKLYSENSLRHQKRLEDRKAEERKAIGWTDERQNAEGWQTTPNNALMFLPNAQDETSSTEQNKISLENTRLPILPPQPPVSQTRQTARNLEDDEEEEPMVNGYGFIEEPDSPVLQRARPSQPVARPVRIEEKPNPFKIAESSKRDRLHEALLAQSRASNSPRPNTTTALRRTLATPKFKSSPALSPAAHRLLASKTPGLRDRLRTPLPGSKLK